MPFRTGTSLAVEPRSIWHVSDRLKIGSAAQPDDVVPMDIGGFGKGGKKGGKGKDKNKDSKGGKGGKKGGYNN